MITVTEAAGKFMTSMLDQRKKGKGIRVGVTTSGCTGYAYIIEFVDKIDHDDLMFESNNIKLFVDKKSFVFINGTEIDYVKEGLNTGLKFKNPLVKDECGCGESFNV